VFGILCHQAEEVMLLFLWPTFGVISRAGNDPKI